MKTQTAFLNKINASQKEWNKALKNGAYYTFKIPKTNGKLRSIEAPNEKLKRVQRKIAQYFQSVYHENLPDCAHGYILKDPIRMISRDIRTNALTHIGRKYLLNIDLKDFFHQVDVRALHAILEGLPLDDNTKQEIHLLCLKEQRLPMGAPSSPVLSNLAFRPADFALMDYAKSQGLMYSRYVDDLSFSAQNSISEEVYSQIKSIIEKHRFSINPKKVKWYGDSDTKLITGIKIVDHTMMVSDAMIARTKKNLALYAKLMRMRHHMKYLGMKADISGKAKWSTIKASIKGHLSFIKLIEGAHSELYRDFKKQYHNTTQPKRDFEFSIYI